MAYGQLMVASHYDFLAKVIAPTDAKATLAKDTDFRTTGTIAENLSAGPCCLRSFVRTDLQFRPLYLLIQEGKLPESEGLGRPRVEHAGGAEPSA